MQVIFSEIYKVGIIYIFVVSGAKLRCDVIVDEIYSIAIETTTHELYLDDSPEEFVIRAMNEEGIDTINLFHLLSRACHEVI